MGINCRLESERGEVSEEIIDPNDLFSELVDKLYWSTGLFHYIDLYGQTIFNGAQAKDFLIELELVIPNEKNAELLTFLNRLKAMAGVCANHPHQYLRFIGD